MSTYQVIENEDGSKGLALALCDCNAFNSTIFKAKHTANQVLDQLQAVSVVSTPAFSLPEKVSNLNSTTSFTATATPALQHTTIAKYYLTIPELNIKDQVFTTGDLKFITPTSVAAGTTLHVSVQAEDSRGNKSVKTTRTTVVGTARVNAPTITVPANGAEVDVQNKTLTVQTSAFSTNGDFTDTHAATDWQLGADAGMTSIIQQALNSTDLVSHTFTNLSLDNGVTCYLRARHKGINAGWGAFSSISTFKAKTNLVTPGGRAAWRHESDEGTVIVVNDNGNEVLLCVADASKRENKRWDTSSSAFMQDLDLTNYTNMPYEYFNGGTERITTAIAKTITDNQLNTLFGTNRDTSTSRQNTDVLAAWSTCAVGIFVRSQTIGREPCDLPNIQLLARIYCEADFIDSMDPTIAGFSHNKLSGWNVGGSARAWSSTEYNAKSAWSVVEVGNLLNSQKDASLGVIPVLEL